MLFLKNPDGVRGLAELYFEIEYVNQPDEAPLLMDIELIEVDDYLDYVIDNNILKSKYNAQTNRRTQDKKISN